MRLMRWVDREGRYGKAKGECSHVWRTRNLAVTLSGSTCQVCEKCGVLHVRDADEADASVAAARGAGVLRQPEGTALGSIA